MPNNILISRETRKVLNKDNRFLGIDGENLQEVLIFKLDEEIDGNAVIEIQFRDETKGFIEVEKTERGYELPVRSSLLNQEGIIKMQLRILQPKLEVFKSEIIRFDVEKAINATATIPDEYPTWIDNLGILKSSLEQAETERKETFTQMQKDTETAIGNIKDMTEKYNENAQAKINEYNANVQLVEPRIVELETQVAELENENAILKSQIPTGEPPAGEYITINDSSDMEFKDLRIGGNSWQETRSGKNLFDKNNYNLIKAYISNNVITSESNNNIIYIPCLPNTTYAISKKAGMRFGVAYTDVLPEIGVSVEGWISNTTGTSIIITTGENANYLVVYVRNGNISGEITLEEVLNSLQIEINSVSTEYEEYGAMPSPEFRSEIQNVNGSANIIIDNGLEITDSNYQAQLFTFPLSEGQKLYKDSYLADDGVHHKRGPTILNGTEDWLYPNILTNTIRFQTALTNAKASSNCLCNRFTEQTIYAVDTVGCDIIGSNFYVRVNQTLVKTSTELKAWLAENPLTVEYELAEEVIEPYTEEQQAVYNEIKKAHSYKNITHIFSTDETSPVFEVTYRKDLATICTNTETVQTMIDNSVGSVIGGEY